MGSRGNTVKPLTPHKQHNTQEIVFIMISKLSLYLLISLCVLHNVCAEQESHSIQKRQTTVTSVARHIPHRGRHRSGHCWCADHCFPRPRHCRHHHLRWCCWCWQISSVRLVQWVVQHWSLHVQLLQ